MGTRQKRKILVLGVSALCILLSLTDCRGNSSGEQVASNFPPAALTGLDKILADHVKTSGLVGCSASAKKGSFQWKGAAGVSSLVSGAALSPESPMRVASITKSFTATVIMLLVQDGLVSLDQTVSTYLPGVHGADKYNVRHILSHRTGLKPYQETPGFFEHSQESWTPEQLVALVQDLPLLFTPGSTYSYSNTNFIVAGMIAEAVTGRSVEELLRSRVYPRAGISRTWLAGREAIPESLARGYSVRFNQAGQLFSSSPPGIDTTDAFHQSVAWTTGALVSTAQQIVDFFEALISGRIVAPAGAAAMMSSPDAPGIPSYGLGLYRYGSSTRVLWGHSGDTAGFRSFAVSTPDAGIVIAVICNDDHLPEMPRTIAESIGEWLLNMK